METKVLRLLAGIGLAASLLCLPATSIMALQEEKKEEVVDLEDAEKKADQPTEDVGYTREEYDVFEKALNTPDLRARATELLKFIEAHPDSKLKEHAVAAFTPLMAELYQKKDMVNLASVAEDYLQLKPEDEAGLGLATEAFYSNKDYAKATKYGEAFYAKKSSVQVAQLLAHSFDQIKNEGKFAVYAEKCVGEIPDKDAFFYSAKLSYYYAKQKNIGKAAQHCQRMMSAYGDETPPGYSSSQWNQEKGRSYSIIGRNAYERKQYSQALRAYSDSLKYYPDNDEAYYYMGMSFWGVQDTTNAMKNLAKAYNLNKPYSKTARAQLEALYKALNNGSLEGIDRITRAAAAEMK